MMKRMPLNKLAAMLLLIPAASHCFAADHLDAPNVMGDGQADINDLFAFQSPTDPNNTVLIMTVNPAVGVFSPDTFGTDVTYAFQIDNDGDAVADLSYEATFGPKTGGVQAYTLTGPSGLIAGSTGSTSSGAGVVGATAGRFDDPFFFDLNGFNNGFAFTGDDFFTGLDVSAIVLEVPSSELGASSVGVWATTSRGGMQVDRMGRPAINTALVMGDDPMTPADESRKTEFNLASPANDFADFGADMQAIIESLSQRAPGASFSPEALTGFLLPDILTVDTSMPGVFPNGRGLTDDVIDVALSLVVLGETSGVSDGVDGNFEGFPGMFPYLSPANVPEPTSAGLVLLSLSTLALRRRRG